MKEKTIKYKGIKITIWKRGTGDYAYKTRGGVWGCNFSTYEETERIAKRVVETLGKEAIERD